MSILLESLKQSEQTEDNDIPSLSDSHFDDEMLSDEWLLVRVKFWKTASFSLRFLLFLVLVAAYSYWPTGKVITTDTLSLVMIPEVNSKPNTSTNHLNSTKITESPSTIPTKSVEESLLNNGSGDQPTSKYQPKIMESQSALQNANQVSSSEYFSAKQATKSSNTQNNSPLAFESLNEQEKRDFPELAINSFAVSSNPAKSFVVINGSFYAPNETISPHLKLVLIDKDGVVVKYKNRLIRKKHN